MTAPTGRLGPRPKSGSPPGILSRPVAPGPKSRRECVSEPCKRRSAARDGLTHCALGCARFCGLVGRVLHPSPGRPIAPRQQDQGRPKQAASVCRCLQNAPSIRAHGTLQRFWPCVDLPGGLKPAAQGRPGERTIRRQRSRTPACSWIFAMRSSTALAPWPYTRLLVDFRRHISGRFESWADSTRLVAGNQMQLRGTGGARPATAAVSLAGR